MIFRLLELMFMEASAMTGDGVEDTFLKCARSILTKVETGKRYTTCNFDHLQL